MFDKLKKYLFIQDDSLYFGRFDLGYIGIGKAWFFRGFIFCTPIIELSSNYNSSKWFDLDFNFNLSNSFNISIVLFKFRLSFVINFNFIARYQIRRDIYLISADNLIGKKSISEWFMPKFQWFVRRFIWHTHWDTKFIFKNSKQVVTTRIRHNTMLDKEVHFNYNGKTGKFESFNIIRKQKEKHLTKKEL